MPTVYRLIPEKQTFFDNNGNLLNGGKLYVFEAGSSTLRTTYTDSDGITQNNNPIVLNSRGEVGNGVYVAAGNAKIRLDDANDVTIWTRDQVPAMNDTSGVFSQWVSSGLTPTYISATSFSVPGDQTVEFHAMRRIKLTDSTTLYGWIKSASYGSSITTVTVLLDSPTGSLSVSLTAVALGLASAANTSVPTDQEWLTVKDFGAVGDGVADDTAAINRAITESAIGGAVLFPPGTYKVTGITVAKRVDLIGIGQGGGTTTGAGATLTSTTNAAILTLNAATQSQWQRAENLRIIGSTGAGSSQHGLVINNAGARVRNVTIYQCGADGLRVTNSYGGSFENVVSYSNTGDGIEINGTCGANVWTHCQAGGNGGHGFNLASMDGSDLFVNPISENNTGRGFRLASGVKGCRAIHAYSEQNTAGTILFDSGSEENRWQFNSYSSSSPEPAPVDNGTRNRWFGRPYGETIIEPKPIQRVYTEYFSVASAAPNTIPWDDTIPQATEGMTIMSRAITPRHIGNKLKIKAWGQIAISAGAVATVSLFLDAGSNAIYAVGHAAAANTPIPFSFEYEYTVTSLSAKTFAVNAGSDSAATITFNGVSGGRKFGGIAVSGISIEEFLP